MSDNFVVKVPGLYSVKEDDAGVVTFRGNRVDDTSRVPRPKPQHMEKFVKGGLWHEGMEVWETQGDAAKWPVPFGDDDLDHPDPHWAESVECDY